MLFDEPIIVLVVVVMTYAYHIPAAHIVFIALFLYTFDKDTNYLARIAYRNKPFRRRVRVL